MSVCARVCVHLKFFLVQEAVVSLQVQVLLLLVAQFPLSRAEQTLGSLQVLLHLLALLQLLTQHQVLGLTSQKSGALRGAHNYHKDGSDTHLKKKKKHCASNIGI